MSETKMAEIVPAKPVEVDSTLPPKYNAALRAGIGIAFASVAEAWAIADNLRKGGAGPEGASTAQVFAAMVKGQSLGIDPIQAMSSITVVKGRASLMGDLALGLIRSSKLLGSYKREWIGTEGQDDYGCKITMSRSDSKETLDYTFTWGEAKKAGIVSTRTGGLKAVWAGFMKRMLYYRALGFAARDLFSDVLMGLYLTEELQTSDFFDPHKRSEEIQAQETPVGPDPLMLTEGDNSTTIEGLEPLAAAQAPVAEPVDAPQDAPAPPQDVPALRDDVPAVPDPRDAPGAVQAPSALNPEQRAAIARLDAKSEAAAEAPAPKPPAKPKGKPRQDGMKF